MNRGKVRRPDAVLAFLVLWGRSCRHTQWCCFPFLSVCRVSLYSELLFFHLFGVSLKIILVKTILNWALVTSGMLGNLFKYEYSLTIRCHANCVTLRSCHNCGVGVHLFTHRENKNKESEIERTSKGRCWWENFTLLHPGEKNRVMCLRTQETWIKDLRSTLTWLPAYYITLLKEEKRAAFADEHRYFNLSPEFDYSTWIPLITAE